MFMEEVSRTVIIREFDEQYGDDLFDLTKCEEILEKLQGDYSNCIKEVCKNY